MSIFKGAGVALVTPFHKDKSIDFSSLSKLVDYQLANETDAIIVCGTTGEPATMTKEEREAVISFVVERVDKRIPVIAGTGGNCTENVIEASKRAEELGVDGLLVVTPYYNKATQKGLYEHYKLVDSAVHIPIIMYNVPSRTGCNILPKTARRIALDCKNVVGIKEASGNISQVAKLAKETKGLLDIYSGNDDQIIPVLSLGGVGVISVLSNVLPKETHEMVCEYLKGNVKAATDLQLKYLDLIETLFCEVNPIPVKYAMHLLGYMEPELRMPLTTLEEEHVEQLKQVLKEI